VNDREELRAKLHILNPALWVLDNKFINENQKPFEFDKHRFMLKPYSDCSPDQVIMKSAQVGWSVAAILKSIHAANYLKLNVIYVLPTRNVVHEFVTPKVNPMIERNPVIKAMVQNTNSTSLKQVGDRFIYFRGSFHEGEAISTTADLVVADEYDRSDQQVLTVYQSRLQASDWGWFWRFSNPSLPGFGVDELYQDSDQQHWFIRCHRCKHNMYMMYEQDRHTKAHYVDKDKQVYRCGSCGGVLTDEDRQGGEWVAKYKGRTRRGYWLSQMMIPWVTAKKIIEQEKTMSTDVFHNFVLGLPYQASEFMINRTSILEANIPQSVEKRDVVIGCDSGKIKHWVMGTPQGIFAYGASSEWSDIETLIKLYDATCVIDALPDFTVPEQLARKYLGRVFVHYYSADNSASMEVSKRKEGQQFGVLQSDRTKLLDLVASNISTKKIKFFQTPRDLEELIYHCEQAYRIVEPDTRGILKAKWQTKTNRPDHWLHALAYYTVGLSFQIKSGEGGSVVASKPVSNFRGRRSYGVHNDKVSVRAVLGNMEQLIEKSIRATRKRRL
jgi:hypothetical protein